jgi:putative ABC transport system permease protein
MARLAELGRRLLVLIRRDGFDRDLAREMALHMEMQAEDNRASGMGDAEARAAASRQFGNAMLLREVSREVWGGAWLDRLGQDVRYALRGYRRGPAFAAITVLVLALGIGGNTAIFSLANALVLNPFPYPESRRLVAFESRVDGGTWNSPIPVGPLFAWQEEATAFDAVAAYGWGKSNVTGGGLPGFDVPQRMTGGRATASFLRVLGVAPVVGRFFTADEDRPDGPPVVVLGHGLWQRRFGGQPDIVGRTLTLDARPHRIVGVMPARLPLPGMFACEFWTPAAYSRAHADTTFWTGDNIVGRVRRGVTIAAAEGQLNTILRAREQRNPSRRRGREVRLRDIGDEIREYSRPAVRVLASAVGLVLLLACVNLAGLLLARGEARSRELAVRASLGASRARLVRQLLTESVLLALAGGALGMLVASWAVHALAAAAPPHLGLTAAVRMDPPVLLFALAVSCVTGVLFGLLPALRGARADLVAPLKGAASAAGAGARLRHTLPALVATEVALAVVLLTSGGLLMKSFVGLRRVESGLRPDHLLTFEIALNRSVYASPARVRAFADALLDRLRAMPGVTAVAAVDPLPMSRQYSGGQVQIDGREPPPAAVHTQYLRASAGYFRTMGIPILRGREFGEADERGGARGLVVNEAFARAFLPNEDPLAHTIRGVPIVGVAGNVRHDGPARPPGPQLYLPLGESPASAFGVAVRTAAAPAAVLPSIRAGVAALDRDLPLDRVRTMEQVVSDSVADERLTSTTVFAFALFALVLASIGIYGVIAYSVSRRAHEVGVRVALGASRAQVLTLMLRTTVWLVLAGVAAGVPMALATSRLIAALLVGVSARDATVLVAVPAGLLLVALAASYVPARRATRINPLDTLRCE